jgi:nucleotide-binding universal stress UspA family protein
MARTGPVVIGYDGSPSADTAIREAAPLLGDRPTLVVVVTKTGLGFEMVELPASSIGLPPAPIDVRTALEVDQVLREKGQRMARHGAELAREAGFADVEGLAVADDVGTPVWETLTDLARERDSQAIVVGSHGHSRIGDVVLGSVSRDVIRHAPCPVLIVRG